jgi:hypothetical protein
MVDLEAGYTAIGIAIETGEGSEGLEIGMTGQILSLSLNEDLLLSGSLEEVLKLVLCFHSNHFIFI